VNLSATLDEGLSHCDIDYTIDFDAHSTSAKWTNLPATARPEHHFIRRACLPIGAGTDPNQFLCHCIPVHLGLGIVHMGTTRRNRGGYDEHDQYFGGAEHFLDG